eukprot:CAMPEP_0184497062 /NCGR_PEP_ID=MMETSP0113_2-20130426/35603_1 /TAXON_ID=91329 /ORGANISM="Norrisiella sphaerica, Strain BC52" /LENGTH=85 /DNA_ID=CAMNT_0026884009 /DNA_START=118 /DNA_END=375 /DNA_ORIENTATION=-
MNKHAEESKIDANYILVCIEEKLESAIAFHSKKKLGDKVIHLQGRVPEIGKYGLRYIPHHCVVDKTGKVVMNYSGDAYKELAKCA